MNEVIAADRLYVVRLSSSTNRKSNRYFYYSIFTWIWAALLVGPICQKVDLIPISGDSKLCTFIFTSLSREQCQDAHSQINESVYTASCPRRDILSKIYCVHCSSVYNILYIIYTVIAIVKLLLSYKL